MSKENALNQETFDSLLRWFDRDREIAGQKYEKIRRRLIQIFAYRGCFEAEELADETINRVLFKLPEIVAEYNGDPAIYFQGVANFVHLEWLRSQKKIGHIELEEAKSLARDDYDEKSYICLEKCLGKLPAEQRVFIVEYYKGDKRAKIERRKNLAEKFGISLNGLQVRTHRIRAVLYECVENCVAEKEF